MCAADQDADLTFVMSPVTAINDGKPRALICKDLDLAERAPQRVIVIRKAAHTDHEAFVQRGGDADLSAELIAHTGLALGDAIHLRPVQGIDLVATLGLLMQQLRHQCELGDYPIPQGSPGDIIQLTTQVAHDAARVALRPFQCVTHELELLGMGIAANL